MRKLLIVLLSLLWSLSLSVAATAQGKSPTLRDEVREKGLVWRISYPDWLFLASLEQMVSQSHIIFRGRVINEKTRLSADEDHVLTDYTIEVSEVYKDSLQAVRPGKTLVITKAGGNLVLDGKPVRIDTPTFPPLKWVTPHIFFIARPDWPGADFQYYFVGDSLGALALENDRIVCKGQDEKLRHPITKAFCNKFGGKDEFLQVLNDRIVALKKSPLQP